jgi:hypothetical protein
MTNKTKAIKRNLSLEGDKMNEKPIIKHGKWFGCQRCAECKHVLTYTQQMDSGGACPYCGKLTKGTIIKCIEFSTRKAYTYIPKWWERIFLFKRPAWHWEEKYDD